MKKLFTILLVVLIILSFGIAFAGKPENGNNKKPENPPCDANHGHPLANFLKQGKDRCQADADADEDDDADADEDDDADADEDDDADADADVDGDVDGDADVDADASNLCTAAAGDPGLLTDDTLAQTLWDGGLDVLSPLVEDPERNGVISGPLGTAFEGTPLEVVGDEAACALDLLLDETVSPIDL
jgi:hypothetical protein